MRLIKITGLAAVAAMAAMAFVGATSVSAANPTQLCNSHPSLTCSNAASVVNMQGSGTLLNGLANVLCLNIGGSGAPLGLASPQPIHVSTLSFTNCGTNGAHTNCEVEVVELPLVNLNKTGLDTGTLTATNGILFVFCENVDIFGNDIECFYDLTNVSLTAGSQHLTAFETPINDFGIFLCPTNPKLDGLLATTANRFILA